MNAAELSRQRMLEDNPMKKPDVVARVAAATRQQFAEGKRQAALKNLEAGRVWTDQRRAAWKEKAAKSWTPEMRKAAAERMAARHAARKVLENGHHDE